MSFARRFTIRTPNCTLSRPPQLRTRRWVRKQAVFGQALAWTIPRSAAEDGGGTTRRLSRARAVASDDTWAGRAQGGARGPCGRGWVPRSRVGMARAARAGSHVQHRAQRAPASAAAAATVGWRTERYSALRETQSAWARDGARAQMVPQSERRHGARPAVEGVVVCRGLGCGGFGFACKMF